MPVDLLCNAACHTAPGTLTEVTAMVLGREQALGVADRGPGLPPDSVLRVLEKFYRVPGAPA